MDLTDYDGYDNSFADEVFGEEYIDENTVGMQRRQRSLKTPLVNDDYNLNSPIMPDIINGLYEYYYKGTKPSHHTAHIMKIINGLSSAGIKFRSIGSIYHTYKHAYNYLINKHCLPSEKTRKFVMDWNFNFNNIKVIPDTFVQTIGSKPYKDMLLSKIIDDDYLMNLLDKYLEINFIIEMMVQGESRVKYMNHDKNWHVTQIGNCNNNIFSIRTSRFNGILNEEVLVLNNDYIIYDKNILLMIKDILIGRFNTLLIVKFNTEDRYTPNLMQTMKSIFDLGDRHVLNKSNLAFEDFTLLEPICINRFDHLSSKTRPLIPRHMNFQNYIESKVIDTDKDRQLFKNKLYGLISSIDNPHDLTVVFSSFRLFGHPVIEYEEGLLKVKSQVRMKKNIDEKYAKSLASDLMKIILNRHYNKTKKWNVIDNVHNKNIPGTGFLIKNVRPNKRELNLLGDRWDELEIDPIFEVPEDIDDSNIFSDKTHSLDLDEIMKYQKRDKTNPIPTKRVLKTYLEKEKVNVKHFVNSVDVSGLPEKALVIGLKAKERELKRFGRFFTLMSWDLRLYFVISEYLIKKDIVKLFDGLTMADSFIDVINKMLSRTNGQAHCTYDKITFANHIDYSKWNNHQRDEAVGPVFSVMDKCYGLTNFFRRSHRFFQDSKIYYPERPEYFGKESENNPFYWEGQVGGFEGIRQKGWSVVGILCLLRESKDRNTKTEFLVQGDNQVIFNSYTTPKHVVNQELIDEIDKIKNNNEYIVDKIKLGSIKLGLLINDDETLQSANFSSYSKIPIYKGNILNLETKKYNRVNGLTNDQLPTSSNIMSSVNSTALSVCQYDPVCRNAAYWHGVFGIFIMMLLGLWNPMGEFATDSLRFEITHLIRWLYLDQCLGGNTGMSLSRLLIRRFPDPITESLSFYKKMAEMIKNPTIKKLFTSFGYPIKSRITDFSFNKLFEDPTALNILKGGNILLIIKDQVKKSLINIKHEIKNQVLRNALGQSVEQEKYLITFLKTINPCFPRFISDFKASSICGYIDQIVGLVQNSRTIRNLFSYEFEGQVRLKVRKWELMMWRSILADEIRDTAGIWKCSSTHADYLRRITWGKEIIGSTIPHPYEYQSKLIFNIEDHLQHNAKNIITCVIPRKYRKDINLLGMSRPYLGSNTKESTSVLQPWEKEITNPLYRKASSLRRGINWLTDRESMLSKSIYNNLKYVTNVDLSSELETQRKRRSGTAEHRYRSDRQSNGGFCNISPNILTWMIITSNNMNDLSDVNYDFMYQASLIYTETVGASILQDGHYVPSFGMGISCTECIREVKNIKLDSKFIYNPQIILKQFWLNKLIYTSVKESEEVLNDIYPIATDSYIKNIPYHVGFHQALGFLLIADNMVDMMSISDLFPIGVSLKINTSSWLTGVIDGLVIGSCYSVLNNEDFLSGRHQYSIIGHRFHTLVGRLGEDSSFTPILNLNNVCYHITRASKFAPPEYPPSNSSLIKCFKTVCLYLFSFDKDLRYQRITQLYKDFKIFDDFDNDEIKLVIRLGYLAYKTVLTEHYNTSKSKTINQIKNYLTELRKEMSDKEKFREASLTIEPHGINISILPKEVRYVVENDYKEQFRRVELNVYPDTKELGVEWFKYIKGVDLNTKVEKRRGNEIPFISGLRVYRCATGAHYKLNIILNELDIDPKFCLIGGDGSGGLNALVLRKYLNSATIFNSLLELNETNFRGSSPGTPQAVNMMPIDYSSRCINLEDCWLNPSDLTTSECWNYFAETVRKAKRKLDLIILDMEARDSVSYQAIYVHLLDHLNLLGKGGTIIGKCYTNLIQDLNYVWENLYLLGFNIYFCNNKYTSSYSTEVYVIVRKIPVVFSDRSIKLNHLYELNRSIRSDDEEFERGLKLNVRKMYSQIPPNLTECYSVYYLEYLNKLGIKMGIGEQSIQLLIRNKEYNKYIDMILYYSTVDVNMGAREIISDNQITRLVCWYIGLLLYISYNKKDLEIYNYAVKLNNSYLTISMNRNTRSFYLNTQINNFNGYKKTVPPLRDNNHINSVLRIMCGLNVVGDLQLTKVKWDNKMLTNFTIFN